MYAPKFSAVAGISSKLLISSDTHQQSLKGGKKIGCLRGHNVRNSTRNPIGLLNNDQAGLMVLGHQ